MSVSSTTTKNSYSGDGSTVAFAYGFRIFAAADLEVIIRSSTGTETTKTLTTHYSVSGVGEDAGGTVTFVTAPVTGETVVIRRNLTLTQGTDYVENDPFPANSHEDALDRLTFITQGIQEELDRAIKASKTNTISSVEFTISAADRANKIFAFDGSGNLSVTQELGTFEGNWAASTAYAERDIVKDTSNNNIYIANTAHTSSGSQPISSNADVAKWDLLVDAASASTSATAAASSATAAASSATAAATSATNAATSATNAATSETNSSTSATNAATSATSASTSATNASTSETNAASSATSAASSATSATASASTATTKASEASTSATNAATSESNASTSATSAASSATTATTKASEASTSATNAASSASAAASSASSASTSATSASNDLATFQGIFHGASASDPTTGLDAGDLYFNTTSNVLRVYNGSAWQDAAVSAASFLTVSNNLSDLNNAATARTNLGVAIGTDVQAFDADTLKADTADVLTAGFAATPYNAGTKSSGTYTPDEANGNLQYAVNGGAHTLAPPTNNCTIVIQYTNNASAGAITTSSFTLVDGDTISTTDGDDFFFYVTKLNGFSHLTVKALQ